MEMTMRQKKYTRIHTHTPNITQPNDWSAYNLRKILSVSIAHFQTALQSNEWMNPTMRKHKRWTYSTYTMEREDTYNKNVNENKEEKINR